MRVVLFVLKTDTLVDLLFASALGALVALLSATLAGHLGWQLADRLPGERRWPHCVFCLRPLRTRSMLPLIGWIARVRPLALTCPCGTRRGQWAQPVTELAALTLGAVAGWRLGLTGELLPLACAFGILPALAIVDLHFSLIPDEFNIALGLFGFLWLAVGGGDLFIGLTVAGALLILGLFLTFGYSRLRGKDMLGLGDVKFFAAAGLWLAPALLPWFLVAAGTLGALGGLLWQRAGGGEQSPFAPALVVSLAGCLLYQIW